MRISLRVVQFTAFLLLLPIFCTADSLSVGFDNRCYCDSVITSPAAFQSVPTQGTLSLVLNADGTISGTVTAFEGSIHGFGMNASSNLGVSGGDITLTDASGLNISTPWGTAYGSFNIGAKFGFGPTTENFTVSKIDGRFSSVLDLANPAGTNLSGPVPYAPIEDFWLETLEGDDLGNVTRINYGANPGDPITRTVPEPGTAVLLWPLLTLFFKPGRRKRTKFMDMETWARMGLS